MGNLDDDRLRRQVVDLEKESTGLHKTLSELESKETVADVKSRYDKFFALAREITDLTKLDRHTLQTFIERIEVGPKEYPEGTIKATHRNMPYRQRVRIFYRFIGEICDEPTRQLPVTISNFNEEEHVSKQSNPA